MLKREDWPTLQASLNEASKPAPPPPTSEDWARLFARLAIELSSPENHKKEHPEGEN